MKRQLFIVLLAILIVPSGLTAQKVYKDGLGRVILDSSQTGEGIGLPAGAVTSTSKTAVYALYTPDNFLWLINATDNLSTGTINATVYEKLEIAPQDLGTSGLGTGTMTMNWSAAFTACKGLNHNGTGWRLPTQRELLLIWIFKSVIDSFPGMTAFAANSYWSATEQSATHAYPVNFLNGNMYQSPKTSPARVRCVREITTP